MLERLLAGRSTREIGRDLNLAEEMVKIRLTALYRMLDARRPPHAAG
ncbi:LuxR C-terminal-related transcriptional regulator [Roseococcus sp.]